jgi:CBS domain containing-hemolysin-like protein
MDLLASITDTLAFDPAHLLEPDMLVRIGIQLMLLCGSAFFSGSETALFSLSPLDLQQLRQQRHPQSGTLHELLDEPRRLIVSVLCGNELVNIAAVANMTGIMVALYGEARAGWISVFVMLPLLLLVGEVTPKTIAAANPSRVSADFVARPMGIWVRLVAPLRWVIRAISERITTWIVGPARSASHILNVDEFRSVIEDVSEEGRLAPSSRVLINNLLTAGVTEIITVMTPRSSIAFLNADLALPDAIQQFETFRHGCVPVYREHRDNLIGFLYVEDVLRLRLDEVDLSDLTLDAIIRPPVVVPLTKKVDEMFDFFVRNRARAAAVLNEFGGVAGFITVDDVLRFIFGALAYTQPVETGVVPVGPDVFEAPGDTKLAALHRVTNFNIHDPRMTTIAGVAFRHLDRLPQVGDEVTVEGVTITVLAMDSHRIARVRVARCPASAEPRVDEPNRAQGASA